MRELTPWTHLRQWKRLRRRNAWNIGGVSPHWLPSSRETTGMRATRDRRSEERHRRVLYNANLPAGVHSLPPQRHLLFLVLNPSSRLRSFPSGHTENDDFAYQIAMEQASVGGLL